MHIEKLLHKIFTKSAIPVDKRNHRTLLESAVTLSECKHLSIAALGRHLDSKALIKHNIKRIDRLFGNSQVQNVAIYYYQRIAEIVVKNNKRPIITVDWSGLTPCGEFHLLRASCPVGGRAITLYESSYFESEYMKQSVHKEFMKRLQHLLPPGCRPIIISDAGFRCPWFKLVRSMGWDFVGRVRHLTQYKEPTNGLWQPIKSLYAGAKQKAEYLFESELAKANPVIGHFYRVKSKAKNRQRKNLRGKKIQCSVSLKHACSGREPWLIFTSLSASEFNPKQIIGLYATRMQIEEAFRDLKNTNNGLGLRHCRSHSKGRLNIALLIAAITTLLLWLVGLIAPVKTSSIHFKRTASKQEVCYPLSLSVGST